eukprot:1327602-Pyramimonas_sp.AAC.1
MRAGDQKIPHYQQPLPSQLSGSSSRAASSGRKRVGGSKCWCSCRASIWLMMLAVTVLNTVPLSFLEDVGDDLPSEQVDHNVAHSAHTRVGRLFTCSDALCSSPS